MNIYLEIFGYIGTGFVLLSLMMTSVVKLRLFNMAGSVINTIYAFLTGTWPVVFLNVGLIIINVWQLIRLRRNQTVFDCIEVNTDDKSLQYFMTYHASDIAQHFPNYELKSSPNTVVYMVYTACESVGVLVGTRDNDAINVELDYSTVKYRDCSVGTFLYNWLKENGIRKLISERKDDFHNQYLTKMGFVDKNGLFSKIL